MNDYEKCLKKLEEMTSGPDRLATTNDVWFCTLVIIVSLMVIFAVATTFLT